MSFPRTAASTKLAWAQFGNFELHPFQKLLIDDGRPVRLGSRAFDLLTILVRQAGCVVSNETLMLEAWPATVVVEQNLRVQISALRRALHENRTSRRWIVNIPGRGYSFAAPVRWRRAPRDEPLQAAEVTGLQGWLPGAGCASPIRSRW